jgi:hypothetical protein
MPRVRSKERVAALREVARSGMGMGRVLISVVSRQSSVVRSQRSKAPPSRKLREKDGATGYWAGVGLGAGASAVTSGVGETAVIFTVARIFSRRSKTLSRSTCLVMPSSEAAVVTFRANS